jgi:DNA-binding LacI/PurR family transcriptional regulator
MTESAAGWRGRVTMADVAREAGVSRTTVSYVLNAAPGRSISASTVRHVGEVAARMGYAPYAPARALRLGRSRIVLSLFPTLAMGHVFDIVMERLAEQLRQRRYTLVMHSLSRREDAIEALWREIAPAAVVAVAPLPPDEVGVIRRSGAGFIDLSAGFSLEGQGRAQAEVVLARGCRRLAFLGPDDSALGGLAEKQLRGVATACADAGAPPPERATAPFAFDAVLSAVRGWQRRGVDAIVAHNDRLGLLVWAALRHDGLRAPEDVAVIGADDDPLAAAGLTTIAPDVEAIVGVLVDGIVAGVSGRPVAAPPIAPGEVVMRLTA